MFREQKFQRNEQSWPQQRHANKLGVQVKLHFQLVCIGYRTYITIIKELVGTSAACEQLNTFTNVIYDL